MSETTTPYQPTELWTPENGDFHLEESIQRARYEMNQENPGELIEALQQNAKKSPTGVSYAILKGENPEEYSNTDALVTFNPFANAATPNMLVRAEFIRRVAKSANVCDDEGKLKPVIMVASPGIGGSSIRLSSEDKKLIRGGELGPAAKEYLTAVSERDYGRIALLGFSQGADMVLAGARNAYSANLDIKSVAAGDPAGVEKRTVPGITGDMLKVSGKDLKYSIAETGLETQAKAFGSGTVDFARFGASTTRPANLRTIMALSQDSFEKNVSEILREGNVEKLVVGYGEESMITKPEAIEPTLQQLQEEFGSESLMSIKVAGRNHAWGDQLTLLAKLYMRSLY